jgi:uncharacterized SAM-binding protein YcdF (DUF218 family)
MGEWIWTLLQPSSIVALLIVLAFLANAIRWRWMVAVTLTSVVLMLAALTLLPLGGWLGAPLETRIAAAPLPDRVDGIVVLGGAVEWRVTLERGQLALNEAGERVVAAAALAQRYPEAKLVFTGNFGDVFEADFRVNPTERSLFFGDHFANRSILFLGQARSTYEDALFALEAALPQQGENWILVTSAWHMPRALGTFAARGLTALTYPVDYRSTGELRISPNWDVSGTLAELDRLVREWGAISVYRESGRMVDVVR